MDRICAALRRLVGLCGGDDEEHRVEEEREEEMGEDASDCPQHHGETDAESETSFFCLNSTLSPAKERSSRAGTIVAGTTDSEGEMVPCSQEEEEQGGAAAWMADIEEETFASTVSDRVIQWANDNAEADDDSDYDVDIAAPDVWDQSGISLEAAAVRVTWWASEHANGAAHSLYDAEGTGNCHL